MSDVEVWIYHSQFDNTVHDSISYERAMGEIAFAAAQGDVVTADLEECETGVEYYTLVATSDYGRQATYRISR